MSIYEGFQLLGACMGGVMIVVAFVACFYEKDSFYDYEG